MNWCHRIAQDFDVSSSASSNLVFQEALDCFVACLSKPDKRMPLAEAIGAKLNVTKVKVGLWIWIWDNWKDCFGASFLISSQNI